MRVGRLLRDLTVVALVFQMVHLAEHGAQLTYWLVNPTAPPWLTPWAIAGRDLLALDGTVAGGNEVLHLVGNLIFLAGLVGLCYLTVRSGRRTSAVPRLRAATLLQGAHVGEHLLLTMSYFVWGSAIGFTTLFGSAQGVFGSSLRIWIHFLLNLGATYLTLRAVWTMYLLDLIVDRGAPEQLEPVV